MLIPLRTTSDWGSQRLNRGPLRCPNILYNGCQLLCKAPISISTPRRDPPLRENPEPTIHQLSPKMPAATFSYAQAAKGKMDASDSSSGDSTPVAGAQNEVVNDDSVNDGQEPATPVTNAGNDDLEAPLHSKTETNPAAKAPSVSDASCTTNYETSGSPGTSTNDSRRDEDSNSDFSTRRSAKDTRSQGPTSRAPHSRPTSTSADTKKNRRERKPKGTANGAKNNEKDAEAAEGAKDVPPPPKVELAEAPIPTVNPWLQRLGTQPAKPSEPAVASPLNPTTPAQPTARKAATASASGQAKSASDGAATNGLGSHRRGGDSDAPRKNGIHKTDSRRVAEQLPSSDSAHWPTPDTAIKEEKQQRSVDKPQDRQDKEAPIQDDQMPKGKLSKKDWVKMDFVPSVSFETPLPQHKGTRPRGGARGGRDGTTRGGHSANPAKDGEKGSSPTSSSTKINGDAREGSRDAPANSRGSSVPPAAAKRGSTDAPSFRDQRKHSVAAPARSKEATTNEQPRDKHENRGERTRGGPRTRGGYHGSSQLNAQHATFTSGYQTNVASRQQNPYSPPVRQNQFGSYGSAPRGGGRGRGGANAGRSSGPNGNGRHAPSSMIAYDNSFNGAPVMGYPQTPSPAFFFDPFLVSTLTAQLSWYFSIQNLCRDMFLRSNMDSQGFVPLSLITGFNRVSTLLQAVHEPVQYVRQACMASRDVEFVVGDDTIERLRTLNNPRHWVLPMEDRVESARNAGPASFFSAGQQYPAHPGMVHGGFPAGSPGAMNSYPPTYGESQTNSFTGPAGPGPELVNGQSVDAEVGQSTTLKPTVPEFSPRVGADSTNASTPSEGQFEMKPSTAEASEKAVDAASS